MAGNDGTTRLIARREGAQGWLILNNPARHNALSLEMYEALGRRVEEFAGSLRPGHHRHRQRRPRLRLGRGISEFEQKRATPEDIARYDGISDAPPSTGDARSRPSP